MTEMLTETIDIEEHVEETQLTEFLPSEILDLAADLIESAGWVQVKSCHGGKYCAGGAVAQIAVAYPNSMWIETAKADLPDSPQLRKSLAFLASVMPVQHKYSHAYTIYAFNDARSTTQADVIAKLHEAADLARQSGE